MLLAAHYDSVPAGPGASDDGADVASMLEIARILAARPPPPHPIVLLITDGEEAGLLGALLFVQRHPLAKQVKAAVNMEARGTSGPSLMFETGTANGWLMRLYGSAIARPVTNSLYYVVYKLLPNDTDFTVFKTAGYQGFNFAFIGNVGRYHTPLDSVANAGASSIQHQGDNALAALSALANSATLHPPVAESVFFDGFARTLIAWPSGFTLRRRRSQRSCCCWPKQPFLLRRGAVTGREIIWGGVGTLCALALGVALCLGVLILAMALGKVPPLDGSSWISQPLPMHLASAAIALLRAAGTGAWLVRRAGFWGFWLAAALLDAVLSVASAAVMPGASFVFLLAAIAAGLGALPHVEARRDPALKQDGRADFAASLPALVIFAALFPLLRIPVHGARQPGMAAFDAGARPGTASALLPLLAAREPPRAAASHRDAAALTALGGCGRHPVPADLFGRLAGADQSRVLVGCRHGPVALSGALRLVAAAGGARRRGALRSRAAPRFAGSGSPRVLRRRPETGASVRARRPRAPVVCSATPAAPSSAAS